MNEQSAKMKIYFVSIHPHFVESYFRFGVFKSAIEKGLAEVAVIDLRKFAVDKHGSIDERPYGGGDGMVMRPEPLAAAVNQVEGNPFIISLSPKGQPCTQPLVNEFFEFSCKRPIVVICGRFGGIDQRFIDHYVDSEVAIGSFVASGGELPGLMLVDAMLRQMPGVLGDETSASHDSFGAALEGRLEHPLYTRPLIFEGDSVPEVLTSGNHQKIAAWQRAHQV